MGASSKEAMSYDVEHLKHAPHSDTACQRPEA